MTIHQKRSVLQKHNWIFILCPSESRLIKLLKKVTFTEHTFVNIYFPFVCTAVKEKLKEHMEQKRSHVKGHVTCLLHNKETYSPTSHWAD